MQRLTQINMLRRVLGVDETQAFTVMVMVLEEALARIDTIRVRDEITAATYTVYPEAVQAYCTPGAGNLRVWIHVTNIGAVGGVVFGRLYGNGVLLDTGTMTLAAGQGGTMYFLPSVDMPPHDYALTVEVGHR